MPEVQKAQVNVGLTAQAPCIIFETSITFEIAKQCVIVFQFSFRRADFLGGRAVELFVGSRAVEYFEEKGLKDWGNQAGFQCADQEV